jgi:hypothetical protein
LFTVTILSGIGCRGTSQDETAAPAPSPFIPTNLIGVYTISEVEQNGTVTMIPPSFATTFTFMADGSFTRVSRKAGAIDHNDSGQYKIEANEAGEPQLLLTAVFVAGVMSDKRATEERHRFSLSSDGEELRMSGSEGKTALFRRIGGPPAGQ